MNEKPEEKRDGGQRPELATAPGSAGWSATIPPEEMAMRLCDDLTKKFRQLNSLPEDQFRKIAEGLVDGLMNTTFEHPMGLELLPDYRRSMDPSYCAGFEVGKTWRKVASEWKSRMGGDGENHRTADGRNSIGPRKHSAERRG